MELTEIEKLYFQITDLWKMLCEKHNTLLDLTCQEYSNLLVNNLDEFNITIQNKQETLDEIGTLEQNRQTLIQKINLELNIKINSINELLAAMKNIRMEQEGKHLFRFNALLIDIIEKIQDQNKRNQLFIQKALLNLREIKDSCSGAKRYDTYTSNGKTVGRSITA